MKPLERKQFKAIRTNLLKNAKGKILELGSGTGINFPLYKSAENVTAIEPSQHMIRQSLKKQNLSVVPIEIFNANAEKLPFKDHSFDTVVGTLVFCTIPNPDKALAEAKRVCKPGGKILLFEHVRMANPFLSRLQDWLTPFWKRICDGCCLNRDTVKLLNQQDLEIISMESFYRGLFIAIEIKKK